MPYQLLVLLLFNCFPFQCEDVADNKQTKCYRHASRGTDEEYICKEVDKLPLNIPRNAKRLTLICRENGTYLPMNGIDNLEKLEHFTMEKCNIHEIPSNFFMNARLLRTISMKNLPITRLDGDLFMSNEELEELILIDLSKLETVDPITLSSQQRLRRLKLHGCAIENESIGYLMAYAEQSLRELELTQHLKVVRLNPDVFRHMHLTLLNLSGTMFEDSRFLQLANVDQLNLSGCYIQLSQVRIKIELRSLHSLSQSLTALEMSHSDITSLTDFLYSHYELFPKLEKLVLDHNKINSIDDIDTVYANNFPRLKYLDLSFNSITQLPSPGKMNRLPESVKLLLQGNPIHCNCVLTMNEEFVRRFADYIPCVSMAIKGMETNYVVLTCPENTNLTKIISRYHMACLRPFLPMISTTENQALPMTKHYSKNKEEIVYFVDLTNNEKKPRRHANNLGQIMCTTRADPIPSILWHLEDASGFKLLKSTLVADDLSTSEHGQRYGSLIDLRSWQVNEEARKQGVNMTLLCTARNNVGESITKVVIQLRKADLKEITSKPTLLNKAYVNDIKCTKIFVTICMLVNINYLL